MVRCSIGWRRGKVYKCLYKVTFQSSHGTKGRFGIGEALEELFERVQGSGGVMTCHDVFQAYSRQPEVLSRAQVPEILGAWGEETPKCKACGVNWHGNNSILPRGLPRPESIFLCGPCRKRRVQPGAAACASFSKKALRGGTVACPGGWWWTL